MADFEHVAAQPRVWAAGSLRVELDMEWNGGPAIGIDGFTVSIKPEDVPALVAALIDAARQVRPL